jgi:four helix bundle protein
LARDDNREVKEAQVHEAEKLRRRTKKFSLDVVRSVRTLPRSAECDVIVRQVLRSAMSTAANYRAVSRCRSRADFISKLSVVIEEADETMFWLEVLEELGHLSTTELKMECGELVSILAVSLRTARRGLSAPGRRGVPPSAAITNHQSQITNP